MIGVPHESSGEAPKAYVVLKDGKTPLGSQKSILEFVEKEVAHYKRIHEIEFIDLIPKSPSGKILRRFLVQKDKEQRMQVQPKSKL